MPNRGVTNFILPLDHYFPEHVIIIIYCFYKIHAHSITNYCRISDLSIIGSHIHGVYPPIVYSFVSLGVGFIKRYVDF